MKALSIAALAGCAIIGCAQGAYAAGTYTSHPELDSGSINVDLSRKGHNQISSHKNFKILNLRARIKRDSTSFSPSARAVQNDKIFGSQDDHAISLAPVRESGFAYGWSGANSDSEQNEVAGAGLRNRNSVSVEQIQDRARERGQVPTGFAADVVLGSDEANELLKTKTIDQPTLDFLKDNNILIPQKGEWNMSDGTWSWSEDTPIQSPGSVYTINAGTQEDHAFEYMTADKEGNVTSSYYNIDLKSPTFEGGSTSNRIDWQKVSAPAEGASLVSPVVEVSLPNSETKYFQYSYNTPSNYTVLDKKYGDDWVDNINNVVYKDIRSYSDGSAIDNTMKKPNVIINADFVNNSLYSVVTTKEVLGRGGAIKNDNTGITVNADPLFKPKDKAQIGGINGNFVNNSANTLVNAGYNGYAQGGAIYNYSPKETAIIKPETKIGDITGDFIGNRANAITSNYLTLDSIKDLIPDEFMPDRLHSGQFGNAIARGGAIYNDAYGNVKTSIGNITGNFIGNAAISFATVTYNTANNGAFGGAIYNNGSNTSIGDIKGNFISNSVIAKEGNAQGGAIYNNLGNIGNIEGSFVNNKAVEESSAAMSGGGEGGAIYNAGTFENVTGDFIGNMSNMYGGAIYNEGTFGNITGDFIGNKSAIDGAIYNSGTLGDIRGNFISNQAFLGGSISNISNIGDIQGDFIGNVSGFSGASIRNYSFVINKDSSSSVLTNANIGNITGNHIGNESGMFGGSIANHAAIGKINGDFIDNKTVGDLYSPLSLLFPYEDMFDESIDLDDALAQFPKDNLEEYLSVNVLCTGYKVAKNMKPSFGGAIFNSSLLFGADLSKGFEDVFIPQAFGDANIKEITGNFVNNTAGGNVSYGGAIANIAYPHAVAYFRLMGDYVDVESLSKPLSTTIDNIKGNFVGNTAVSGGAISNFKMQDESAGPLFAAIDCMTMGTPFIQYQGFLSEYMLKNAEKELGYPVPPQVLKIGNISGNFVGNSAIADNFEGFQDSIGYIYRTAEVTKLAFAKELFKELSLPEDSTWEDIEQSLDNMIAAGKPDDMSDDDWANALMSLELYKYWCHNYATLDSTLVVGMKDTLAKGGAIFNFDGKIDSITNSSFIGNKAVSKVADIEAQGGAIWTNTDLKIVATDGYVSTFDGNYVEDKGKKRPEAIYVRAAELNLDTRNQGKFLFNDEINGNEYKLNITGDNTGVMVFNNNIKNAQIMLNNNVVNVSEGDYLSNNNSLSLNSGTLNIQHTGVTPIHFNDLNLTSGQLNLGVVDVDLAEKQMGRITADSYSNISEDVKINVGAMNLLSDSIDSKTEILFADNNIKNNVQTDVASLPMDGIQTAYTPIYKYAVSYDKRDDGGFFIFNRAGGGMSSGNNPSNAFNPAVFASPIASQSGALSVTTQTFNYAFQNADNFMNIPSLERISMKNANKYALAVTDGANTGNFSPIYTESDKSSVWVKPYASFESVPLKNGPKITNNSYGTLVGFDTALTPMKNGWDRVWTGYIGYNGASQRYSGVDSTQNGGLLGGTLTLYKDNFFNATTLSAGASVASVSNMYGHEDFTMLLAGVGNKTGYNFEFKEGKVILQPSMFLSYTFVNTFDYTNAAGVKISSDPLHAIQVSPGMKLIGNFKGGWQPYLSVNMVWNLLDKSNVTAGTVKLPQMSIKPYVQYGVGIQKRFKDRCMAFGQAMIQNGGRNGISLTAGFRWALGKEGKAIEKVQAPVKDSRHSGLDPESINAGLLINQNGQTLNLRARIKRDSTSFSPSARAVQGDTKVSVQNGKIFGLQGNNPNTLSHCERAEFLNERSEFRNSGEGLDRLPRLTARNDVQPTKTVLKQLSPAQKTALGKRQNTTRTTSAAVLRAL